MITNFVSTKIGLQTISENLNEITVQSKDNICYMLVMLRVKLMLAINLIRIWVDFLEILLALYPSN